MLPISFITISFLALLYVNLSMHVVRIRRIKRIGLNSGGDTNLAVLMRARVNLIEASIWVILLLICAELNHVNKWMLIIPAAIYIFTRYWYAYSFVSRKGRGSKGRIYGTATAIFMIFYLIIVNAAKLLGIL